MNKPHPFTTQLVVLQPAAKTYVLADPHLIEGAQHSEVFFRFIKQITAELSQPKLGLDLSANSQTSLGQAIPIPSRADKAQDIGSPQSWSAIKPEAGIACRVRILILGDLFDFWTAFPVSFSAFQRSVLEELQAFRRVGGQLVLIQGNKDHFFRLKKPGDSNKVTAELYFDYVLPDFALLLPLAGGGKMLFHHGDIANPKDYRYLVLRFFLRIRALRWGLKALPDKQAKRVFEKFRCTLLGLKFKPQSFPEAAWVRWSTAMLDKMPAQSLTIGHFHPKLWMERALSDGRSARVMPAWFNQQNYLEIQADGKEMRLTFY